MGTPEMSILACISKNYQNENFINVISWLNDFGAAFIDITQGIFRGNTDEDVRYHRRKVAVLITTKVIHSEKLLTELHYTFVQLCETYDSCVPNLDWNIFFESLSMLGLGPEFITILSEMDEELQDFIGRRMYDWVEYKSGPTCQIENHNVLVTFFLASLVLASTILKCSSLRTFMNNLKECYVLLQKLLDGDDIVNNAPSLSITYRTCINLMIKRIQMDVNPKQAIQNVPVPDIIHLRQITQIIQINQEDMLRTKAFDNICKSTCSEKNDHNKCFEVLTNEAHLIPALKSIDFIYQGGNKMLKDICTSLKDLLTYNESNCMENVEPIETRSDYATDVFLVAHCLSGYQESAARLLNGMACLPSENDFWINAFASFKSSPECLALRNNLLLILDGIANCKLLADAHAPNAVDMARMILDFQQLFWKGFKLLAYSIKFDLARKIIYEEKKFSLLSEFHDHEYDHSALASQQEKLKKIRLFFDSLINHDELDSRVRDQFSYICMLSPQMTIENLVERAFYDQHRLAGDLIFEWDFLLQFSHHGQSTFWTKFFDCCKYHSEKDDEKSLGNGIQFVIYLSNAFASHRSKHYSDLIREGFELLANRLSNDTDYTGPHKILTLKVLDALLKSKHFADIITAEELLVVSVILGERIDASSTLWQSDPNYNENEYETLDDVFETLINMSATLMKDTKNQDHSHSFTITDWLKNVVKNFQWTTNIRFLPILQLIPEFRLPIPACLAEVCKIPEILHASSDLSYGTGTGLLAWHQCFVTNAALCPLHNLDIKSLDLEGIKLFTAGWIVTLSQVLPFCKSRQWLKLVEATKILIGESKLYCPYQFTRTTCIPKVDLSEAFTVLGVVQVMKSVFEILCNKNCITWTGSLNFSILTKQLSAIANWIVSGSPEFDKATLLCRFFILSQIFCSLCYIAKLILGVVNQEESCTETIFVICLDLLNSFERIFHELENSTEDENNKSRDASLLSRTVSLSSNDSGLGSRNRFYYLELASRIDDMTASAPLMGSEHSSTLTQKLDMLSVKMKDALLVQ